MAITPKNHIGYWCINTVLVTIFFMLLSGCAGSFSKFSRQDLKYQYALTGATVVDLYQTSRFDEYPLIEEENPALSNNPSDSEVISKGSLGIAGQWFVVWASPKKHRRKLQMFMLGVETRCVVSNRDKGVKLIK